MGESRSNATVKFFAVHCVSIDPSTFQASKLFYTFFSLHLVAPFQPACLSVDITID